MIVAVRVLFKRESETRGAVQVEESIDETSTMPRWLSRIEDKWRGLQSTRTVAQRRAPAARDDLCTGRRGPRALRAASTLI